eukprot:86220-Lingulodinium_polyedra.AAC.1
MCDGRGSYVPEPVVKISRRRSGARRSVPAGIGGVGEPPTGPVHLKLARMRLAVIVRLVQSIMADRCARANATR